MLLRFDDAEVTALQVSWVLVLPCRAAFLRARRWDVLRLGGMLPE